jgi:hypothetical protein
VLARTNHGVLPFRLVRASTLPTEAFRNRNYLRHSCCNVKHRASAKWPPLPSAKQLFRNYFSLAKRGLRSNSFSGKADEGHSPMAKCSFNVAGSNTIV